MLSTILAPLVTILAFLVAILLLVSLHEFGHYIVARWCGIKVLRFSIGFGKPFFIKKRGDTEWCLAPIPLGGYVKMVDTREGNVAPEDLPYAFDKQHPAKRIAVVLAGPIMNLLLAVLFFFIVFFAYGYTEEKPVVGTVVPSSLADKVGFQVGDRIIAIDGIKINSMSDVHEKIILDLNSATMKISIIDEMGKKIDRLIDATQYQEEIDALAKNVPFGISSDKFTNEISFIDEKGPAYAAGLRAGDTIVSINKKPMLSWFEISNTIAVSPGKSLEITYIRQGVEQTDFVRVDSIQVAKDKPFVGRLGIASGFDQTWAKEVRTTVHLGVVGSFNNAVQRTYKYSKMTLEFFGKMIIGKASKSHISGPLTIADYAGKTAAMGLQSYLNFLALVSVSLGVLNLLPIPVLDGGHFLYYVIEWIRGKPLSEKVQSVGFRFGLTVLLLLMCVAFFNDFTRIFG